MKKHTILLLILITSVCCNAQIKRLKLSEIKIGAINCTYNKSINIESNDTSTFIYLGFQNNEYKSITDIISIYFDTSIDSVSVFKFVKDLKTAYNEIGNKSSLRWDKEDYTIILYDFTDLLYLAEPRSKGKGYTQLTKKQVENLVLWFESIGFSK